MPFISFWISEQKKSSLEANAKKEDNGTFTVATAKHFP